MVELLREKARERLEPVPNLLPTRMSALQMSTEKAHRQRIRAGLLLFLVVAALSVVLSALRGDVLRHASYDLLHRLAGEAPLGDSPVVIVYLDLASYKSRDLDPLKPWPREL